MMFYSFNFLTYKYTGSATFKFPAFGVKMATFVILCKSAGCTSGVRIGPSVAFYIYVIPMLWLILIVIVVN